MQQIDGDVIVISPQRSPGQWIGMTTTVGCPPGLEYLAAIDQLIVKQRIEVLEAITGFETENSYDVTNSMGQPVFFAKEESSCLQRQFCEARREFTIHITDNFNKEVLRFYRQFKCCAGCCWCAGADCCAFVLRAETPDGEPLGYVRQRQSGWSPHMGIYTPDWELIAVIRGPCCTVSCPCCPDVKFQVLSSDESTNIGLVCKQWSGLLREAISDADTFSISFPADLDIRAKATMFGALFLIDFMFFEDKQQKNNR